MIRRQSGRELKLRRVLWRPLATDFPPPALDTFPWKKSAADTNLTEELIPTQTTEPRDPRNFLRAAHFGETVKRDQVKRIRQKHSGAPNGFLRGVSSSTRTEVAVIRTLLVHLHKQQGSNLGFSQTVHFTENNTSNITRSKLQNRYRILLTFGVYLTKSTTGLITASSIYFPI